MRFVADDPAFVYSRPCFSPRGDRIMFMRTPLTGDPTAIANSNDSDWSLWTVPATGGTPTAFFHDPVLHATRPDWSWATGRVAFTGIQDGRAGLWLLDEDGANPTNVPVGDPAERQLHYPSWYPDGRAVALTDYRARQVLRIDLDDGTFQPLTDPQAVWAGMCSVSADSRAGNPVAFAGQRPSDRYDVNRNVIWIVSGGHLRQLDGRQGRMPAWSPDGSRLASVSKQRRRPAPTFTLHPRSLPSGQSAAYVTGVSADPDGLPAAQPVTPFGYEVVHAKWSPDGTMLACAASATEGEHRGIAVVELHG
jgi:Tol biopolymer transport system component